MNFGNGAAGAGQGHASLAIFHPRCGNGARRSHPPRAIRAHNFVNTNDIYTVQLFLFINTILCSTKYFSSIDFCIRTCCRIPHWSSIDVKDILHSLSSDLFFNYDRWNYFVFVCFNPFATTSDYSRSPQYALWHISHLSLDLVSIVCFSLVVSLKKIL